MQDYYGNEQGLLLGPYGENEITSRLTGLQTLQGAEGYQVYALKATSYQHAKFMLASAIARDKRESK